MKFFLQTCDGAGQVLDSQSVEAQDVYSALVHANRGLYLTADAADGSADLPCHIDVADREGHLVARLLWSEAMAAIG